MRVCPGCRKTYPVEKTTCEQDGLPLLDISRTFADIGSEDHPRPTADGLDRLLTPGMMVGEYMVERMLAEGGMGNIYAGVHPLISKRVAIKVLSSRYASSDRAVARFVLEARSVNQIGHHNIVDIFSIGELDDGRNYMVMELLDGLPLHEVLQRVKRFKPGEVLPLYEQLCDALEATHEKGFVHRDLKPDNIIVLRRPPFPFIKILDFGITKLRSRELKEQTEIGTVLGTPEYMAPEQCRGDEIDARADIYALGVMLYEFLTGQKPFFDPNPLRILTLQMRKPPKPPSTLAPISQELEQVVLKAMEKDRNKRFASAQELFDRLDAVVDRRLTWRFNLDDARGRRKLPNSVPTVGPNDSPDATPTPPPARPALPIAPPRSGGALAASSAAKVDSYSDTELQPHASTGRPVANDFALDVTLPPPSSGPRTRPKITGPQQTNESAQGGKKQQRATTGTGLAPSSTLPMPFGAALAPQQALSTPEAHELDTQAKTEVDDYRHARTVIDEEEYKTTIQTPMIVVDTGELNAMSVATRENKLQVAFEMTLPPASGEITTAADDDEFADDPTDIAYSSPTSGDEPAMGATIPLVRVDPSVAFAEEDHTELVTDGRTFIDPSLLEAQREHQRALMFTAGALMVVVMVLSLVVVLT